MNIIGIDEVGRGCWAGPLVAGAVMLAEPVNGLRDSKKLSLKQRVLLEAHIMTSGAWVGLGWVSAHEVDELGLTKAVQLAMRRALVKLPTMYDQIIIDGHYNFLPDVPRTQALVRADDTVPAVSAASIVAKVARDRYMAELASQFPVYGFEAHVGYGTQRHAAALKAHGLTKHHRRSFKPIQALLK